MYPKQLTALLILWLGEPFALGFVQELIMYENSSGVGGNFFHFESNVADSSEYPLKNITRICYRGFWRTYSEKNYIGSHKDYWTGASSELQCKTFESSTIKSFRHYAASETEDDALSLYAGSPLNGLDGPVLFITQGALAGINMDFVFPTKCLAISGGSKWTLFEGQNFNGKSYCFGKHTPANHVDWTYLERGNLSTVGSVFKGCNFPQYFNTEVNNE